MNRCGRAHKLDKILLHHLYPRVKQSPAGQEFYPRVLGSRFDGGVGRGRDGHWLRRPEPPQQLSKLSRPGLKGQVGRQSWEGTFRWKLPRWREMQPCSPKERCVGLARGLLSCPGGPIHGPEKRELSNTAPGSWPPWHGTEGPLPSESPGCALSSGTQI